MTPSTTTKRRVGQHGAGLAISTATPTPASAHKFPTSFLSPHRAVNTAHSTRALPTITGLNSCYTVTKTVCKVNPPLKVYHLYRISKPELINIRRIQEKAPEWHMSCRFPPIIYFHAYVASHTILCHIVSHSAIPYFIYSEYVHTDSSDTCLR